MEGKAFRIPLVSSGVVGVQLEGAVKPRRLWLALKKMVLFPRESNVRIESDPSDAVLGELIKKNLRGECLPTAAEWLGSPGPC